MYYMGGKERIARHLVEQIRPYAAPGTRYVELMKDVISTDWELLYG